MAWTYAKIETFLSLGQTNLSHSNLMTPLQSQLIAGVGVLASVVITFVVNVLWGERIKADLKRRADLALEEHKAKLALASGELAIRRQLYDELSTLVEELFGIEHIKTQAQYSLMLNRLFAKLALYAPDDVYTTLKQCLIDKFYNNEQKAMPDDVKPVVYAVLRKSLFGDATKLSSNDLVRHVILWPTKLGAQATVIVRGTSLTLFHFLSESVNNEDEFFLYAGEAPPNNHSDDCGHLLCQAAIHRTANNTRIVGFVDNSGTAGYFRIKDSGGKTKFQGTITSTQGGGDIEFENTSFVQNGLLSIELEGE